MLRYQSERTWADVKLEFDNDAGTKSGTTNRIALERAYFGGRIVDTNSFTFDGEIGRRNLDTIFDSKIEFSSIFDGILLKFSKIFDSVGNFYVNMGPFVVDEKQHHFGYAGEIGALDIGNTGLFLKYSIIDWKEHRYPPGILWKRYNYVISQGILGFQFNIASWKKLLKIYSAFLYNHAAKPIALSNYKKEAFGFYFGFSLGQVSKKGDWALDVNYQYVSPQAVPEFDASGIKRGNAAGVGFFTEKLDGSGKEFTTRHEPVGGCNFKGAQAELLYSVTNNLVWLNNFCFSDNVTNLVGPHFHYYQFESELIYAF